MTKPWTALLIVLALTTQGTSGVGATAQNGHAAAKTIVGAWFVHVTPTVQPPFVGLITFNDDGNAIETNALTLASSLESPGHGQWIHLTHRRYALTFVNLEVNPDGSFAGTGRVRSEIHLNPESDEWNGTFEVDIRDPDGNVLVTDSGTVSGTRIAVEK